MSTNWKLRLNRRLVKEFHDEAARGLALGAEHVLGEAKKLVPIEEHILEESGTTSVDNKDLKAAIVFDTPYAVYQHEELHLKHDEGREAKYLETAINGEIDTVREIIAQTIRGEL